MKDGKCQNEIRSFKYFWLIRKSPSSNNFTWGKWYIKLHSFYYCFCNLWISYIFVKRKHLVCGNFQLPVFDGLTCFRKSWIQFDCFWKMSISQWHKNYEHSASKTNAQNFLKLYIQLHLNRSRRRLHFGVHRSISRNFAQLFCYFFNTCDRLVLNYVAQLYKI